MDAGFMDFPHTLYFIRHGETDWNRAGRFQGQTETDLNDLGQSQAARNGDTLKDYLEHAAIAAATLGFVTSPMRRVRQTTAIVRARMGLVANAYDTDDRLKEIAYGTYEGRTPAEIKRDLPEEHQARKRDKWGFNPEGGESYAMFSERVGGWLSTVDGDMIVIAHGGVSRVLRGHLLGLDAREITSLHVPQDKIMILGERRLDWL